MSEIPAFIYVLNLIQPELFNNMSSKEEKIIDDHFGYLKKGLHEGILVLAGPCLDGAFGIVIVKARSREEAEDFMSNDPAVKGGLMRAELHPFRISLIEPLNK